MLAPQQTIMRANANLRYEGAGASLPTLNHLDFEHPIYFLPCLGAIFELILSHNARIAPSNKLKNSSKMQVKNCGTISFIFTKKRQTAHWLICLFWCDTTTLDLLSCRTFYLQTSNKYV